MHCPAGLQLCYVQWEYDKIHCVMTPLPFMGMGMLSQDLAVTVTSRLGLPVPILSRQSEHIRVVTAGVDLQLHMFVEY